MTSSSTTSTTFPMDKAGVVGEKTPLLISVSATTNDITPATSATTTPESSSITIASNTSVQHEEQLPKTKNENPEQGQKHFYLQQKAQEIESLLSEEEIDLWKLRDFALTPGGLVNDTIRKRAWPKLVGLDHKYEPLPVEDILPTTTSPTTTTTNTINNDSNIATAVSPRSQPTPTIEIDAQHELLQQRQQESPQSKKTKKTNSSSNDLLPPAPTLIVESMDSSQIDRDVARCTWHLLTGSQRSRRSQHKSIRKNSTRGKGYARQQVKHKNVATDTATSAHNKANRIPRNPLKHYTSSKYRRSRKVAVLLKKKQNRLANLINLTLVHSYDRSDARDEKRGSTQQSQQSQHTKNRLRYYQGYHDVACIFLHALGGAGSKETKKDKSGKDTTTRVYQHYSSGDLELPSKVLCQVSFSHFKDALRSDFLRLQTGIKLVLFPLLSKIDRPLHDHLLDADMEPFFCLSWILTWFAHDVRDTALVKRLFDFFLVGHQALPIYTCLAMMCHPYNRQRILETDCDFAALHQCLASLPKHSCKVGYKAQAVDGFGNVVVYVSDDEGENPSPPSGDAGGGDTGTVQTGHESYLEDQRSEFDEDSEFEDDSHTMETRSHVSTGGDSIYTESSFPTSVASASQFSSHSNSVMMTMKPTIIAAGGGSLASGSLKNLQAAAPAFEASSASSSVCPPATDRTMISTEEPDFLSSKESTLVSGKWNDEIGGGAPAAFVPTSVVEQVERNASAAYCDTDRNPVPFESVLDSALQLMKSYPPRSLVGLAKKYFGDDWNGQLSLLSLETMDDEHTIQELIGLLDPSPPAWSILPSCSSDWMDKQRQRQDLGLKATSRKDRRRRTKKNVMLDTTKSADQSTVSKDIRRRRRSTTATTTNSKADALTIDSGAPQDKKEEDEECDYDPMDYVRSNPEDRVVVAIGYGPGMDAKIRERRLLKRRRKRQRALVIGGCGILAVAAVWYGSLNYASTKKLEEISNPNPSSVNKNNSGSSSSNNRSSDAPTPPRLRQLRFLDDTNPIQESAGDSLSEAFTETTTTTTAAARTTISAVSPQLTATLRSIPSSGEKSMPQSPGRQKSSSVSFRRNRTGINFPWNAQKSTDSSITAAMPDDFVRSATTSNAVTKPSPLTLAFHGKSPVLEGLVRKTKLVLARFAQHWWVVCRGYFASPFRLLLTHHKEAQQHYANFVKNAQNME